MEETVHNLFVYGTTKIGSDFSRECNLLTQVIVSHEIARNTIINYKGYRKQSMKMLTPERLVLCRLEFARKFNYT